jgi:hypothetical protein
MDSSKDYVFANWREAAAHAKDLFGRGEIDMDEYGKILARAKNEQGVSPLEQGSAQQGQIISGAPQAQPSPEAMNSSEAMSGRALPVQSLPTWDQVVRFFRELQGTRPAY